MFRTTSLARTAAMIGEPARASMLLAMMSGQAFTATELAGVAGVTPQTASGHLAQLVEAGLVTCAPQGRFRYHRLRSAAVAEMLEGLMSVGLDADGGTGIRRPATGPRDQAMRRARTCYDHLAGTLAVAIADRLVAAGRLELSPEGGALTEAGEGFLTGLGMDLESARRSRTRLFCRPCLDWSERRPHIAGALGAALCRFCLDRGWVRRVAGSRALDITPTGGLAFRDRFGVATDCLRP